MFLLGKPSEEIIRQFVGSQQGLPFSYAQPGATGTGPPAGYTIDHNRIKLGEGADTYQRAISALRRWQHFDLGWLKIVPPGTAIAVGNTVAVQSKTFGLWSLSACRIVYVIDEEQEVKKFGFAYGTLPDHVESGEERFMIEWEPDDSVWYDIFAFSRPQHPLVRLGRPLARRLQKQFARESLAAMLAASRP
jgi:uncharacterized protein (UPF0548 family)